MISIGIVSCDEWIGKIKEDLLLQQKLYSMGIVTDIISWEDKQADFNKYDCLILRSAWGYHKKIEDFYKWLNDIEQSGITLLNSPNIIKNNIQKNQQFELLKKHDIPLIDTVFIKSNELNESITADISRIIENQFYNLSSFVIKPIISGSGNNTYILSLNNTFGRPNEIALCDLQDCFQFMYNTPNNGLMIQPFISGIDSGETASIFIDGLNTHNVKRFPNIFHDKRKPEKTTLTTEESNLANRILSIPDYQDVFYARVDMVDIKGIPTVMEVELAEPDLMIKAIEDKNEQDKVVGHFAKKLVRRMNNGK